MKVIILHREFNLWYCIRINNLDHLMENLDDEIPKTLVTIKTFVFRMVLLWQFHPFLQVSHNTASYI